MKIKDRVEAYLATNPNAKVAEVAKACGCKPAYVYTIKANAKKAKGTKPALKVVKDTKSLISGPVELKKANELQVGGEHYRSMKVQPWDALEAWLTPEEFRGYQKGTAISYLARERSKGGDVDVEKATHHLMKLLETIVTGARS